jgi:hypothetical protein
MRRIPIFYFYFRFFLIALSIFRTVYLNCVRCGIIDPLAVGRSRA